MKFYIISLLLALLAVTVSAVAPQKAIIVTYPEHTPNSVVQDAMNAIIEAGGVITHEYSESDAPCLSRKSQLMTTPDLFKGFAAKASAKALETVTTMGAEFNPVVEEDSIVSIDGDTIANGHIN